MITKKRRIEMENGKERETSASPNGSQPRMPRWTRREMLALVRAKHDVEGTRGNYVSGRGKHPTCSPDGGHVAQPKWTVVSDGCRIRGVHRGPMQCRKRWANLIAAFRKITHWEEERVKKEEKVDVDLANSVHVEQEQKKGYWEMEGEERKAKGLPGRFDKVVYDEIMEGKDVADMADRVYEEGDEVVMDSEEEEETKAVPPSVSPGPAISVIPISMRRLQPSQEGSPDIECGPEKHSDGTPKRTSLNEGMKRKRSKEFDPEDEQPKDTKLLKRLTDTVERGTRLVAAQLEAQTIQLQMDRNQRKDESDGLLKAVNRLADAVMKIAEKL